MVASSGVLLCGCQRVAKGFWVVARRLLRCSGWLPEGCFFWGVVMWLPGGF